MPSRSRHVRLAVLRDGPMRTEDFMGRPHLVFPAVLVREQVLTNNLGATFLPFEEIAASVDAWNSIPVVERHPMLRGSPVTARTPAVMNATGVGFIYNARAENNSLKADIYLDPDRVAALPDTAGLVANVQAGEPGELSTGFATMAERIKGVHNGQAYDLVLRGITPDHLALLPDELGACSVTDGCGLGVNCRTATAGNCGCGGHEEPAPGPIATLVARMEALGRRFRLLPALNESDDEKRQRLMSAVRANFGGPGRDVWLDSVHSDESFLVYEIMSPVPELNGLFRVKYTMAVDGAITFDGPEKVRRVTVFEPVANATGEPSDPPSPQDRIMNRAQMIAHLARPDGPLTEAVLNALSDQQLTALCGTPAPAPAPIAPAPVAANESVTLTETRRLLRTATAELEALKAQTANALAAEERDRVRLVEDLVHNGDTAYSITEIEAMGINELRTLHATVFKPSVNHAGRGGPRAAGTPSFAFITPILDGPVGASPLDPKQTGAH